MGDDLYGPGFVYLIERDDGWFKIGRTANLEARFRQIRWQYGRKNAELTLLCLCRAHNQASVERLFHRIFQHRQSEDRHRGLGPRIEWFHLIAEDLSVWRKWADVIAEDVQYCNITLTDDDWLEQVREAFGE